MTIAPLNRITVIGRVADKDRLLKGLQALGCLHLVPMALAKPGTDPGADGDVTLEGGTEIANASKAVKFLTDAPYQRRQVRNPAGFNLHDVVDTVLDLKTKLRLANDKRDFLLARIADVEPWGEIDFSPAGAPGGQHLWFYELPLRDRARLDELDLPWAIVGADHRTAYVVVIAADEPQTDLLPVPRIRFGAKPLSMLRDDLLETEIEIDDLMAERVALTRYLYLLTANLYEAENAANLKKAAGGAFEDGALVAVQGWAPQDRVSDMEDFTHPLGLAFLAETPSADDMPPTLLRQPETRLAGVDLAMFYQVPGYHSWDPSLVILASFTLFFAMIMSDAGYGFILALGLAAFWRRLAGSPRGRAYRRLGVAIISATIFYGMLVGSYFGVAPPQSSIWANLKVISVDNFDVMMKLSVGIGVAHVVLANVMAAWAKWGAPDWLSKFGWIAVSLGAYGFWIGGGVPTVEAVTIAMMGIGTGLIFLFSSPTPVRRAGDVLRRLADGTQALTGAMTAFGDILSYMRLFALGLASASLAITFNQLAAQARAEMPGLGLLVAVLILLVGHGLNFVLAIISGVVHGLRLNYIEFFKWGFEGEGYAFKPFARKEVEP